MTKLDLANLARMGEFNFELNSLGNAVCVSLNTGHLVQVEKKIGKSVVPSLDVVRWLFGEMVRRPANNASSINDLADNPRFTAAEVAAVTDFELAEFAGKLIQKNSSVLGGVHKGGGLELAGDESASDFLVRAFRDYFAKQKAQLRYVTQSLSESLSTNTALQALERSKLAVLANTSQYAATNSLITAVGKIAKRDQDRLLGIDSLAQGRLHLGDSAGSLANSTHFKSALGELRAAASLSQNVRDYAAKSTTSAMLAKDIYLHDALIRDATLGLAHRVNMFAGSAPELDKQQRMARELLIDHEAMFRFPQALEAIHLLDSYQIGAVAAFAQGYAKDGRDQQRCLEAMTTPWLSKIEASRSVTGILELQGIGKALRTINGFDRGLTEVLRLDLGDWRDKITFPESVFIDPLIRTDFYVNRGFNTVLTDFPESAFQQSLKVTGLDGDTLDIEVFGQIIEPSGDPEEEAGLQRTNKCHDRLQRFERLLRQFINDAMTTQYGSDWPRKRLDPKLYENWEFKKRRAESSGVILTFIEVADFTDYETIICKQDHWREVFEARFKKKESVRESLQRLQPIRLAAMHARIVTKEDELYLFAEVVRLASAIKLLP